MPSESGFDRGLLDPLSAAADAEVTDAAVLAALVTAEVALARAWRAVHGRSPDPELDRTFGWIGAGEPVTDPRVDLDALAADAVSGGNPVIPLVKALHAVAGGDTDLHRGATSQDILDSALVFVARRAVTGIVADLRAAEDSLAALAIAHRDTVAPARTLTQHAVPTTLGARVASWIRGIRRARRHLEHTAAQLPAQLGGAGGTLASSVVHAGTAVADRLPAAFAAELGLAAPEAPWHTERWPVTELGDALVQTTDALGVFAADVLTGARPEIGEWIVAEPGGSSAMPQKRNPTPAVLLRAAAIRAPHLAASLHSAAAFAVDERPDGAWHAEWPALRELLRLTLGAAATARRLAAGLRADTDAVARNLAISGGLLVAERLSVELGPTLGSDAVATLIARAGAGEDLRALVQQALDASDRDAARIPVDTLLDPAQYTGLAVSFADRTTEEDA